MTLSSSKGPKFGVAKFWNNYWFYPAPLFNLAVCRIFIVGFQLGYLLLRDNMATITTRATTLAAEFTPLPIFQLLNAPFPWERPPLWGLNIVYWVTIMGGVLSLIGLKSRLALPIFAFGSLYIKSFIYSHGSFHHTEAIMMVSLVALALSPAGKSLSVDDFLSRLKRNQKKGKVLPFSRVLQSESSFARWPLLLVQWLFAITYLSAAFNKIVLDGDGLFSAAWMNGYTLQTYLLRDGTAHGSDLGVWLGHQHVISVIFSWVAVIFEGTFWLTLVFPKLIWFFVPAAAMFHMGIYMAQRADFFQYLALYAVFIPWTAVFKMLSGRLQNKENSFKSTVYYDIGCPRCLRKATMLGYFDWLGRLTFLPSNRIENDLGTNARYLHSQHGSSQSTSRPVAQSNR